MLVSRKILRTYERNDSWSYFLNYNVCLLIIDYLFVYWFSEIMYEESLRRLREEVIRANVLVRWIIYFEQIFISSKLFRRFKAQHHQIWCCRNILFTQKRWCTESYNGERCLYWSKVGRIPAEICQRIVWVCLAILWDWWLKG